jgi:hypothetical protein
MSESALWKWFRDGTKHLAPYLHMQRIENSIALGTPDVEGAYHICGFVIELKCAVVQKNGYLKFGHDLTTDQAMFLRARAAAGEASWILVRIPSSIRTNGYLHALIHARHADDLLKPMRETRLWDLSIIHSDADPKQIINTVCGYENE